MNRIRSEQFHKNRAPSLRLAALLLCALLLFSAVSALTACAPSSEDGVLRVVCTVFPIYDWARVLLEGEDVELTLLVDNGTDLHSYQPTAADRALLASCDLLIRVGGSSDEWIEEMLKSAPSDSRRELVLSDLPQITLREISSSSVAEPAHGEEGHHHHAVDEHLWLSLRNASVCVEAMAEELSSLFGEDVHPRKEGYLFSLSLLDSRYSSAVSQATDPRVLFCDRFPFVYLLSDYNIAYLAAFEGCTTDTDAGFDTVIRLANTLDEWKLSAVAVTEDSDGTLARRVIGASSQKDCAVLTLTSMQAVSRSEIDGGISYLSVMEENLSTLCRLLRVEMPTA